MRNRYSVPQRIQQSKAESDPGIQLHLGWISKVGVLPSQHGWICQLRSPDKQGFPHCLRFYSPVAGCAQRWVNIGCLLPALALTLKRSSMQGVVVDHFRRELILSCLHSPRAKLSERGIPLDTNNKLIIHSCGHWTLQIPKGKHLSRSESTFKQRINPFVPQ
jgi:hypothetical protein